MNKYEEKQEQRRQRLEARAVKAAVESDTRHSTAITLLKQIPPGQPILIGHHSEAGHRRHLRKVDNNMRKSIEAQKQAEEYARRAAAVGTGGISSDDPEAIEKLTNQLEALEKWQATMIAANKLVKKKDIAGLLELGFSEESIHSLLGDNIHKSVGFPRYKTTNNGANIRRIKGRIAILQRLANRGEKLEQANGYTYRENMEENRIMFKFPGVPPESVRRLLGKNGFKFSRTRDGSWVRQITPNAIATAKYIRPQIEKLLSEELGND